MEFGLSSKVDCGQNVVGLSWTSALPLQGGAPSHPANLLITTTESRVAVHAGEDNRLLASWLTRPGSYNRFTVAAVQNRATRRFYCVQNGNRLFSWHEKDASLESASKLKLEREVYALRTSKKLLPLVIVYMDGGLSLLKDTAELLVSLPGRQDGTIATWARLTAVPAGSDSRFILMVLKQKPLSEGQGAAGAGAAPAGKASAKQKEAAAAAAAVASASPSHPCLLVYSITIERGSAAGAGAAGSGAAGSSSSASGGAAEGGAAGSNAAAAAAAAPSKITLKCVAQHQLVAPSFTGTGTAATDAAATTTASSSSSRSRNGAAAAAAAATTASSASPTSHARISSIALHKLLNAVSVVWSNGDMQVLQFPHTSSWYLHPPRETVRRRLARLLPASEGGHSSSAAEAAMAADSKGRKKSRGASGAAVPAPSSSSAAAFADFQCASFALEPYCLVLAGSTQLSAAEAGTAGYSSSSSFSSSSSSSSSDGSGSGTAAVAMSVWDARYGVVLGSRRIDREEGMVGGDDADADSGSEAEGDFADSIPVTGGTAGSDSESEEEEEEEEGASKTAAASATAANRASSSSSSSNLLASSALISKRARSEGILGSLLSAAQAVTASQLTPDSIFQVTVSEDNAYVAVASRRRVLLTPVAARGASLVSAIAGMLETEKLLASPTASSSSSASSSRTAAGSSASASQGYIAPSFRLSNLLGMHESSAAAEGGALLQQQQQLVYLSGAVASQTEAWSSRLAVISQSLAADCSSIADRSKTATAADVLAVLAGYAPSEDAKNSILNVLSGASAASAAAATAGSSLPAAVSPFRSLFAGAAFSSGYSLVASCLPAALVAAAVQRCQQEIKAQLAGAGKREGAAAPAAAAAAAVATPKSTSKKAKEQSSSCSSSSASAPFDVCAVLAPLLSAGVISSSAYPELLPTLLKGCSKGSNHVVVPVPTAGAAATARASAADKEKEREEDESKAAAGAASGRKRRHDKISSSEDGKASSTAASSSSSAASPSSSSPASVPVATVGSRLSFLQLLAHSLFCLSDVPERLLVRIFQAILHSMRREDMAALWSSYTGGDAADALLPATAAAAAAVAAAGTATPGKGKKAGGAAAAIPSGKSAAASAEGEGGLPSGAALGGLMLLSGLLVRAPRNDVLMEQALQGLSSEDVAVLLGVLLQLTQLHARLVGPASKHTAAAAARRGVTEAAAAAGSGAGGADKAAPTAPSSSASMPSSSLSGAHPQLLKQLLPSYGQVVDWMRMCTDAHFSRLVLLSKARSQSGLQALLQGVLAIVSEEVALCEALSGLRGQLLHILAKGSLPASAPPEHSLDVFNF